MAVNTQLQVRRGSASQWTSANPTLAAGEFGFESDTGKFKIGTGSTAWTSLAYASLTTSDIPELSQDAVDQALVAGTGITKTYNDGANTLTLAVDTTAIQARVTDVSDTEIGYLNGVTSGIQTQIDTKAPLASPTLTGTVTLPESTSIGDVSNLEIGYLNGVTSAIQTQLNDKLASSTAGTTYAPIASPTFTGTVVLPNSTVTNDMLAGSIANNKLANSSVTINGSAVSLGGSTTIQAGPDEIAVIMGALI